MEVRKEVIAAISAAVGLYLQAQQAAPIAAEQAAPPAPAVAVTIDAWGMSGRQAMMDLRRYLQLRMLR